MTGLRPGRQQRVNMEAVYRNNAAGQEQRLS